MFQEFLLKKMMGKQLESLPEDKKEKIIGAIMGNPDLFKKIAEEIQKEIDIGKDQMSASMSVMSKYKKELKELI